MKIPSELLQEFEQAAIGIEYGSVALSLFIKQGQPRYVISREESFIPKKELSISEKESE